MYAIAVSDIHLGYDRCDKSAFEAFISELENPSGKILTGSKERIEHLVLIGDILDFWRGQNERVLLDNMNVLQRINDLERVCNIHFVWGNHDYSVNNIRNRKAAKFRFTDNLRLPEKDEPGTKARFSSLVHLDLESFLHSPGEGLDILALGHRSNDEFINSTQSVYAHLIGNPP